MAAREPETQLELVALQPGDRVTGLSVGDNEFVPLKIFFKRDAKRYESCSLARTYVVREAAAPQIIAYVTLVCGQIETQDGATLIAEGAPYPYKEYPAIKVARLLVGAGHRRRDIGRKLIEFSLGIAKDIVCPAVGCRFMVVDSKRGSVDFYKKCGFTLLDTPGNLGRAQPVMFIDLHKI